MSVVVSETSPARDALHHRLAAWLLSAAFTFLRVLPAFIAYGIADLSAPLLAWRTARRDRRIYPEGRGLRRNAEIVFREDLTPTRLRNLLRRWARHMTHLLVDFARMPRITADNYHDHVSEIDTTCVDELVAAGKGVIFASAHAGVWELLGYASTLRGTPISVIARPIQPPAVDAVVNAIRTSGGHQVASKWGVLWGTLKALRKGASIGVAADEDVSQKPRFVPFLGTLASANSGLAQLHRASRSPIVVVTCARVGRMRYQFRVWGVIQHTSTDDHDADLLAVLTDLSAHLSRAILAHPEQWLWGTRRFRTRPPGEEPGPDGLPPVAEGDRTPIHEAARALD